MNSKLGDIFNFTQEDLEANRRGVITDRQKRKVLQSLTWQLFSAILRAALPSFRLVVSIIAFAVFFLLPELLLSRPLNLSNLIPYGVLLWTLSFLGLFVFLLYILWDKVYAIRDLALNRLSFVSGRPYFSTQKRGNARLLKAEATLNIMCLGGSVEFVVPEAIEDMLDQRRYYRLYHLTRSQIILSIEEISETH